LAFFPGSTPPVFIFAALLFGVPFGLLLALIFLGVALALLALALAVGAETLIASASHGASAVVMDGSLSTSGHILAHQRKRRPLSAARTFGSAASDRGHLLWVEWG
jgi:hypothetical protein